MRFLTLPNHVVKGIQSSFGSAEGRQYLIDLVTYKIDEARPEPRKGFSRAQLAELLEALELHDTMFPGLVKEGLQARFGTVVFHSDVK